MAITDLIFKREKMRVGTVQFDASVREVHTYSAEATSFPVEDGSVISDHVRRLPDGLEIYGIVTNTPVVYLASLFAPSPIVEDFLRPTDRVEAALNEIIRIMEKSELVDVITSLKEYRNMALLRSSIVRDADKGNILDCTMTLRSISIVTTRTVLQRVPIDNAKKTATDLGKKVKTSATPKQKEKISSLRRQIERGREVLSI